MKSLIKYLNNKINLEQMVPGLMLAIIIILVTSVGNLIHPVIPIFDLLIRTAFIIVITTGVIVGSSLVIAKVWDRLTKWSKG